jgi:hypothetical protein
VAFCANSSAVAISSCKASLLVASASPGRRFATACAMRVKCLHARVGQMRGGLEHRQRRLLEGLQALRAPGAVANPVILRAIPGFPASSIARRARLRPGVTFLAREKLLQFKQ